ncbi:transposase [Flavivirga jejuensis]|uniref:transposase n=1 Tax=Flavivirga jejuensis TaxID=870487 RepID=UPI003CD0AA13
MFNTSKSFHIRIYGDFEKESCHQTFQNLPKPKVKQKPYLGNHFYSRGYFVSTGRLDEDMIKRYMKYQEYHE